MKVVKLSTTKSVEDACKEIEKMIPAVLGTKPNKCNEEKSTVYYPARGFAGTDDDMDDVRIVVRKVNNSLTSIKLENSERMENADPFFAIVIGANYKIAAINHAYEKLERVLRIMFPKS